MRIDMHPDALILKLAQRSVLRACICAKCGYTEFFIDPSDAEALHPAHLYAGERRNLNEQCGIEPIRDGQKGALHLRPVNDSQAHA